MEFEKIPSILVNNNLDEPLFWNIDLKALQVMANKQNQTVEEYFKNLSEEQFVELIKKSQSKFMKEDTSSDRCKLKKSSKYSNMNIVVGTNILVDTKIAENDSNLDNFINLYKSGKMVWYRGLSVTHFSYKTFYETGLLFSEGVEDVPMFTMGNDIKTRWLPGVWNDELPASIAHQIYSQDTGLNLYWSQNIMLPIGVVVAFKIEPTMPIAYLNDSEQVIRGPVMATLHKVIYSSKDSDYEMKLQNLPRPLKFGLQGDNTDLENWVEMNRLPLCSEPLLNTSRYQKYT